MTTTLAVAVRALETLYPLHYAEDWDHPGLIAGDLTAPVTRIAFAADPTEAMIDRAIAWGANLIVSHHPLFFRAVHQVSGAGPRGDIVRKLAQAGCALWVGHTNADAAWRGVGMAAADAFGLTDQQPLVPINDPASPHPVGLGRVGTLPEPVSLGAFARRVYDALPMHPAGGIQIAGSPDQMVHTVALLPGSGDSMFEAARASGADVYVTSDLRHHPALDDLERSRYEAHLRSLGVSLGHGDTNLRPALINTPHSAIESIWFTYALEDVPQEIIRLGGSRPACIWMRNVTDPWTFALTPAGESRPVDGTDVCHE